MKKNKPFRALTLEEYGRLTPEAKLAYIDEAIRARKVGSPGSSRKSPAKRSRQGEK
jgi:hypothetical protein